MQTPRMWFVLPQLCIAFIAVAQPSPRRHLVTFDDMETVLYTMGNIAMAPNGQELAYVTDQSEIYVISTDKPDSPLKVAKGSNPVWSPDSARLGYYSEESGTNQLWEWDLASHKRSALSNFTGGIKPDTRVFMIGANSTPDNGVRFSWSPDGSQIVFASLIALEGGSSTQDSKANPKVIVLTADTPPDWTLDGIFRTEGFSALLAAHSKLTPEEAHLKSFATELFIVDTRSHTIRQLTHNRSVYFAPSWMPDGKAIICLSPEGRPLTGWGSGPDNIYSIDVQTGYARALTRDSDFKHTPRISPDGKWISYLRWSPESLESISIIPVEGGKPKDLTQQLNRAVDDNEWISKNSFAITEDDGVNNPLLEVDLARHTKRLDSGGDAWRGKLGVSSAGSVAWFQSDPTGLAKMYYLNKDSKTPKLLLDLNPQVNSWDLGEQEVFRWKNSSGEDREGILIKPVGYKPGKKYPMIIDGYPNQGNYFRADALGGNQAWAGMGYVIFQPNPRTPHVWEWPFTSYSAALEGKGPHGLDVLVDDVLTGVHELVRSGLVDQDRIGLFGLSNGGAVVNDLVFRTSVFKCAVSVGAAWSTDWIESATLLTDNRLAFHTVGAMPWDDPSAYVALSGIFHLKDVTTPMLLFTGDDDGITTLDAIKLYNGLRWLKKPVTLVRYPGSEHVYEGAALRDYFERTTAFFDTYLHPEALNLQHK